MRLGDPQQKEGVSMSLSRRNNDVVGERKSEAAAAKKTRVGKSSGSDKTYLQRQRDNAYSSRHVRHSTTKPPSPMRGNMDAASDCGTSSITVDAVPDALLRCNSPFLDAIFGGSAGGKDLTSSMIVNQHHPERDPSDRKVNWQARQRIASSLLEKTAAEHVRSSLSTPMHGHRQEAQLQQRGWSSGVGNTTSDSVSEMSLMSEFLYADDSKKVDSNENESATDERESVNVRKYAPENQTRIMAPNVDRLTALSMYVLPPCCLMLPVSLFYIETNSHLILSHLTSSHLISYLFVVKR